MSEPNDFEDVDEGEDFDDEEIDHEELKEDDPPISTKKKKNKNIPSLDEAPTAEKKTASTTMAAVIEGIRKECRDSQGTMDLWSVFTTMLTQTNTNTITLNSFIDGCNTLKVDASNDELENIYNTNVCVSKSKSKPKFAEFYLFVTNATSKKDVLKSIASVRKEMMTNMNATSNGDFGLNVLLKNKFTESNVHNLDVRELLNDQGGLKISDEDWNVLAPSFPDPLLVSKNIDQNNIHWQSFSQVFNPEGIQSNNGSTSNELDSTSSSTTKKQTDQPETKDDTVPDGGTQNEVDDLNQSSSSPLESSWKLLQNGIYEDSPNTVDYRPNGQNDNGDLIIKNYRQGDEDKDAEGMTTKEFKKFLKKIDSSFSSLYSSDYELSIQGSFDVKGNNMLDINSYQKWCMRRSIQNGSYEYMTTLLSIVSHEKKKKKKPKLLVIVALFGCLYCHNVLFVF